jgi:hypothetical protein
MAGLVPAIHVFLAHRGKDVDARHKAGHDEALPGCAMADTMARMEISTETSTWLLQARDFLEEARRLRPGPARNELRQTAKVLRELARLEAKPVSALDLDWPQRT